MPQPLVIDLSHHNVVTDLHKAAGSGIAGVIHKATEGTSTTDRTAHQRFEQTRDAGMLWGIYHFLRPGNIIKQADYFLSKTDLIDDDTLLVLDFEVDGISLLEVQSWLRYVESKSGQEPVLYTGHIIKALGSVSPYPTLAKYRLWLAQYGPRIVLPKGYADYWLWQYSESGKVDGIGGQVDLNAYKGTARDLRNDWVIRASAAVAESATTDTPNLDSASTVSASEQPPPINTKIEAEITPEGGVKIETNGQVTATKERIAVVKPNPKTWTQAIVAKITAAVSGNALFQWIWSQQDKITGVSLPDAVWIIVSLTIAIGFLLWILYEILDTWQYNQRQDKIDTLLVEANSTPDNLAQLIPADEVDLYRAKGFKIITRGEKAPA